MALVLANRVQETSTTTGTGTLTLAGAVLGFQTFAAGIGAGNTCYYAITSTTGAWEVGVGTVGTGTLARTTLLSSSTGSFISFTGTLNVYVTYPSEKSVNLDESNNLTVLNTTRLGGAAGNQSLQVNNVASAVNYAQIVGTTTTGTPTYSAQGTDTNIGLSFLAKGTGGIFVGGTSVSNPSLLVSTVTSQVNSFQVYGHTTGNAPTLAAIGSDTNIGIAIQAKGTGAVAITGGGQQAFSIATASGTDFTNYYNTTGQLNYTAAGGSSNINFYFGAKGTGSIQLVSGGGTQAIVSNTASAVNYLNFTGAATGAAPVISAQGSDANITLAINSKGTGYVALGGTTSANSAVRISPTVSSVNFLEIAGGATGIAPSLIANGTDTSIGLNLTSKGVSRISFQGFTFGQTVFDAQPVASAVNFLRMTAAVTTGAPSISAQGTDTNIGLVLNSKGTGVVALGGSTAANSGLQVKPTVSGVNYVQVNGNTTGNGVNIQAEGSDADVALSIRAKGTFNIPFFTGGGTQFLISHTGSAVNYAQVTGAATGAAPTISAQGSDANINLNLAAKVNGYVYTSNANGIATRFFGGANYLTVGGTGSGSSPTLNPDGVDSNITLVINGKNTGGVAIGGSNAGNSGFRVFQTTSSVNYVQALGAVTTGAPELSAQGSDANINLKLTPKGTGGVWFTGPLLPNNLAGTAGQVLTSAGAGAVPTWAAPTSSNITANGLFENNATISANYTIGSGNNAVSAGPITINAGVVVTVPSGSTWVVV